MNRTNLINHIIKTHNFKYYLEIGMGTGHNFKFIKCQNKVSVDPDKTTRATIHLTSDEYFNNSVGNFDVIFIDGLHHADQARKDLDNAWNRLNDNGFIILHDTNPHSEHITHVPRDSKEWCGDIYKLASEVANSSKFTLGEDHGVTVIKKDEPHLVYYNEQNLTWQEFDINRIQLLNIKSWSECLQLIQKPQPRPQGGEAKLTIKTD